ncbi:MAG: DUF3494 domain-containing protein [Desulfamplus sp.]|nr:DUF3494 domain-containing protein [Desulfamplus sp.]
MTGFSLIADSTNTFSTSSLVTGKIYASNYAPPTPANMTTAISDMETAYTDAAGRTLPDFTEYGAGDISGMTLVPGLYKWGTGLLITSVGVILSGSPNDVWIFQIAEDLIVNNSAIITLSGGAQAKNIFWQVSGQATLGTSVQFKGIILSKKLISLNTGTEMNGRALAQTTVTLDSNTVFSNADTPGTAPIVSETNYINGDILRVTLPPNYLNQQRFVAITIPGFEELFFITTLNEISLFDGQNLLRWAGQEKVIELEVTSDFPEGEYTVYLFQLPAGVDNPLEQTDLWELGSTTFKINASIKPDTVKYRLPEKYFDISSF